MAQTGLVWVDMLTDEELRYHLPYIREALKEDEHLFLPFMSVDQIIEAVLQDKYQAWMGGRKGGSEVEIYALTQCLSYPNCRAMSIVWCNGTSAPDYFARFVEAVEAVGGAMKCQVVEIRGRIGWQRALHQFGYKPGATILFKEISDGERSAEQRNADQQGGANPGAARADGPGDGSGETDPFGGHPTAA